MSKRGNSGSVPGETTPTKKPRYVCRYLPAWSATYKTITASKDGPHHVFCTVCNHSFSVGHSGKNDVERHLKRSGHTNKLKAVAETPPVTSLFGPSVDPVQSKANRAEALFVGFVIEHDISFLVANHFTDLVPVMFPDSAIAKKFACKRVKTSKC